MRGWVRGQPQPAKELCRAATWQPEEMLAAAATRMPHRGAEDHADRRQKPGWGAPGPEAGHPALRGQGQEEVHGLPGPQDATEGDVEEGGPKVLQAVQQEQNIRVHASCRLLVRPQNSSYSCFMPKREKSVNPSVFQKYVFRYIKNFNCRQTKAYWVSFACL